MAAGIAEVVPQPALPQAAPPAVANAQPVRRGRAQRLRLLQQLGRQYYGSGSDSDSEWESGSSWSSGSYYYSGCSWSYGSQYDQWDCCCPDDRWEECRGSCRGPMRRREQCWEPHYRGPCEEACRCPERSSRKSKLCLQQCRCLPENTRNRQRGKKREGRCREAKVCPRADKYSGANRCDDCCSTDSVEICHCDDESGQGYHKKQKTRTPKAPRDEPYSLKGNADQWTDFLGLEDVVYLLAKRRRHRNDEKKRIEDWLQVMNQLGNDQDKSDRRHQKRGERDDQGRPGPEHRYESGRRGQRHDTSHEKRRKGGESTSDDAGDLLEELLKGKDHGWKRGKHVVESVVRRRRRPTDDDHQ